MLKQLIAIITIVPGILLAQHTIKGKFIPPDNYDMVLLYKVTPVVSEYITNAKFDKGGNFVFKLDSTAAKGIYRLVYAVPQEAYNFDVIYNGKEDIVLTFNSETGVTFHKSNENKLLASYTNSMSMVTQSISNYFRQNSKDTLALKAIFKTQRETQANFEKAGKETIALEFIKANKPFTPKYFKNISTYSNHLKTHYFDYVDFNNITLQSSSFLQERMLNYVFGMTADGLDETTNYKNNIDVFYKVMHKTPMKIKKVLLADLWQQMVDLNFEQVSNYIAEAYLINIANSLNDKELANALSQFKNLSIGQKAPDFSFEIDQNKKKSTRKLSELNGADKYIIVFWSSTCSHCLDEIPQLQSFINKNKAEKIKVIAIGLESNISLWKSKIESLPEFIHVYGKDKWDNSIAKDYGVKNTPTYYVLDKVKRIVLKPEDFDALQEFLSLND